MEKKEVGVEQAEVLRDESPARQGAPATDGAQVDKLIRHSVYGAMGVGIVPLHWFQFASVAAVQLNLVRQLSNLYGVAFKEGIARKIIASVAGAGTSTLAAPLLRTAVASIPLVGLPLAVGAQPLMNGLTTYAVGRMFVTHFERGGSFVNANVDEMKQDFGAAYQRSREWLGNVVSGQKEQEQQAATVS